MLGLNKGNGLITKFQLVLLVVWLSFTVLAFSYFIQGRLVNFDADHKLRDIEHQELAPHLISFIEAAIPNIADGENDVVDHSISNTIIHFSQPNCDCQQYSEAHIKDINQLALNHNFAIKRVVMTKDNLIPATPSVAIIDNSGDVIYFGPYGQGIACSQTSGYAQTMLNNYVQGYSANIVIKEAKGCYCAV
ncbi:DUF6436 domain-containing protein [Colwellia ponticola]|uniref:DUF6436 domain-containing protein n=1 Tax=Colwellia ponticola TaxID=2304625 RepID=A0A8H2JNE9_9GAMM|nr:DUF6436 domain-containing protein [Colwellia ponticola]TMM45387.1 hypothetical protein FCS21_08315 [Colwellia ponticola]